MRIQPTSTRRAASLEERAERRWDRRVSPYARVLEELDWVRLSRRSGEGPPGVFTMTDFLLLSGETFVDLIGTVVLGLPHHGIPDGFMGAQIRTWVSNPEELTEICTSADVVPEPRPPGLVPGLLWLAWPFVRRHLYPAQHRPYLLHTPLDLLGAVERHRDTVSAQPDQVVRPPADALDWRWSVQEI